MRIEIDDGIERSGVQLVDPESGAQLVQTRTQSILQLVTGMPIYELLDHIANSLREVIPDREFSVSLANFVIENKVEDKLA